MNMIVFVKMLDSSSNFVSSRKQISDCHSILIILPNWNTSENTYLKADVHVMVAYFCHYLSDNYVDLSDIYVDLSDLNVDLSLIPSVEK